VIHLDILNYNITPISSPVFLEILKQTPQLFSLTIDWNKLKLIFNDSKLCKYLNKMIKKLRINADHNAFVNNFFEVEQFCEVFSNVEHLRCEIYREKNLSFLLFRLPKLSSLHLHWVSRGYPKEYFYRLENEVRKQNIIYDISVNTTFAVFNDDSNDEILPSHIRLKKIPLDNTPYDITVLMWFGKNLL
jgi:hypothetical protein